MVFISIIGLLSKASVSHLQVEFFLKPLVLFNFIKSNSLTRFLQNLLNEVIGILELVVRESIVKTGNVVFKFDRVLIMKWRLLKDEFIKKHSRTPNINTLIIAL